MFISGDVPSVDPDEDRLGYAPLAHAIALGLCRSQVSEGMVIAIYGPWGAGKSSLLNYIKHYVRTEQQELLICDFNPWWFSGRDDLARLFLDHLAASFGDSGELKKAGNVIKSIANVVADFPVPVNFGGFGVTVNSKEVAKAIGERMSADATIPKLKEKVNDILEFEKQRVIVFLDDIDRLTSEEIRQLFRLIKAVADFRYVTYVLAFEKSVVCKALEQVQDLSGSAYLEKIVQVPFELPTPDTGGLQELLFERLNVIMSSVPDDHFDNTYFLNLYLSGLNACLKTPRDVVRITNTLAVTLPAVQAEVNVSDFIAIEFIRVFYPEVYDLIRQHPQQFAGYLEQRGSDEDHEFHDRWLSQQEESDSMILKALLVRLFPRLESIWKKMFFGPRAATEWHRKLRICSPERFPVYFRFSLPQGAITSAETQHVISISNDAVAFGNTLVAYSLQTVAGGRTRVRQLLEMYFLHLDKVADSCIRPVCLTLFEVGDQLSVKSDDARNLLDVGNSVKLVRIIRALLERTDESERLQILLEAFTKGKAIQTITKFCLSLSQEHGKYGADRSDLDANKMLPRENVKELAAITSARIEALHGTGELLTNDQLPQMLFFLQLWLAKDKFSAFVKTLTSDCQNVITILKAFYSVAEVSKIGDKVGNYVRHFDLESLDKLFDLGAMKKQTELALMAGSIAESDRALIEQYHVEYEKFGRSKKIPSGTQES